jgi:hypothetical protein
MEPELASKVRNNVKRFLRTWLGSKNQAEAIQYFSASSFNNAVMFVESCAGYVKGDRSSPEVIRQGVNRFLEDGVNLASELDFAGLLAVEGLASTQNNVKSFSPAMVKKHGFILVSFTHSELRKLPLDRYSADRLRAVLPTGPYYVVVLAFGDGLSYLLWANDPTTREWKIFHAGLICM